MTKSWPVVFFGSGPVAARTLESIVEFFDVESVITRPKPAHGHTTTPPVEALALKFGLKHYTPANKQELADLISRGEISSFSGLVVDYGLIIPQSVIDYFEKGIVNSHFSLLPLWRGADPITFPLLAGDKQTGVSLMLINAAMDEGELLVHEPLAIDAQDTGDTLTAKLVDLSNQMLVSHLPRYLNGEITPYPQDAGITPSYAHKLKKEDGLIDWNKPAEVIEREIRAYQPWPKSYTSIAGTDVVLLSASVLEATGTASEPFITDRRELAIYCGEKTLIINQLVVAGKGKMGGQAFVNGYMKERLAPGA